MNRDASLTVTTPFGTDTLSGEFEKTGSTFGRTMLELVHGTERSTLSGRYSTGTGEFSIESPYIQLGPVKAITGRFNHADGHIDAELTWAPSKTVSGYFSFPVGKIIWNCSTVEGVSRQLMQYFPKKNLYETDEILLPCDSRLYNSKIQNMILFQKNMFESNDSLTGLRCIIF